jgi:recombination protein RecA
MATTGLDQAIEAVRKQYGDQSIRFGAEAISVPRIQTGSLELDVATAGGFPVGRISRCWGGYSSGKSLMSFQIIRGAQKQGKVCAYYDVEKTFEPDFVKKLGVDLDKLVLVEGTMIEEVGTKMDALLESVDVHVIDSCGAAVSLDELNAKVEDWQVGLGARAWGKVLKRIGERMDKERHVIILLDQARETFGYGGSEHPPNGRMMEHASSLTLYFRRGGWLYYDKDGLLSAEAKGGDGMSGMKEADGYELLIRVNKSKVCPPFRSARCYWDFHLNRFDAAFEFMKAAKYYGIAQRAGAWFTLPDGTRLQGEAKLRLYITENVALRKLIYKQAMSGDRILQTSATA